MSIIKIKAFPVMLLAGFLASSMVISPEANARISLSDLESRISALEQNVQVLNMEKTTYMPLVSLSVNSSWQNVYLRSINVVKESEDSVLRITYSDNTTIFSDGTLGEIQLRILIDGVEITTRNILIDGTRGSIPTSITTFSGSLPAGNHQIMVQARESNNISFVQFGLSSGEGLLQVEELL